MLVNCEKTIAFADGSSFFMTLSSSRRASILVLVWKDGREMRVRMLRGKGDDREARVSEKAITCARLAVLFFTIARKEHSHLHIHLHLPLPLLFPHLFFLIFIVASAPGARAAPPALPAIRHALSQTLFKQPKARAL